MSPPGIASDPAPEAAPPLPATDIFLGLAAILLVALALVSANMGDLLRIAHDSARPQANSDATRAAAARLAQAEGRLVMLVRADGVTALGPENALGHVMRDDLPDTTAPARWLAAAPAAMPLVILGPDAGDSAFLLEAALGRNGAGPVGRVRLTGDCAALVAQPSGFLCVAR